MTLQRRWAVLGPVLAIATAALIAVLPWLGVDQSVRRQIVLVALLAMVVSGLNLSLGYAGELALGQVFMYATGAYVAGYLSSIGVHNLFVVLAAAAVAALIVGVITGAAGLRLGGWMLALSSLLLLELIPAIVHLLHDELGGFEGMAGIRRPDLFGGEPLNDASFYVVVVVVTALWLAIMRNFVKSREGTAFLMLKASPVLGRSLGLSVFATKLRAYAVASAPAGVAGALYAFLDGYISPAGFTFELGLVVLAASILGGSQSIYGAIIGAAILQLGPRQLNTFDEYAQIAYGVLLVVGGVLLGSGVAGIGRRVFHRFVNAAREQAQGASAAAALPQVSEMQGKTLSATDVVVKFGGFTAINDASLSAAPGMVTSLIGPNGSGKTTMLNVISGLVTPASGAVSIGGAQSDGSSTFAAHNGIARTFQTPLIPEALTVREVAASGRVSHQRVTFWETVFRLPRYRAQRAADLKFADEALAAVGLTNLAGAQASTLPLGQRRLLEFARAIAAQPAVLLLDEVASGLDEAELADLARLIRAVRDAGATVVLVEHNFELVRQISDHVVVLAEGAVLTQGDPEKIARDERVIHLYLGTSIVHTEPATTEEVQP